MAFGTRVIFEALREKDFGDITGSYTPLGIPIVEHVRLLGISSSLNQEIYISFDGTTDHLRVSQNSFKLFDLSANKVRDDGLFMEVGTQIYVKYVGTPGVSGTVWVEIMAAEGGV